MALPQFSALEDVAKAGHDDPGQNDPHGAQGQDPDDPEGKTRQGIARHHTRIDHSKEIHAAPSFIEFPGFLPPYGNQI
jgi:hypothetical protein